MRLFVTISVGLALIMIGYGVMASRGGDDAGSGGSDAEQAGIVNMAVDQPDAVPTMPIGSGESAAADSTDFDGEYCVEGDPNADTSLAGKMIIVDPGHGGEDLGTVNTQFDLTESELVLPISRKLRDRLVSSGADVCLTRVDDTYTGLGARSEFANEHDGDAFVSIHLNSLPDPDTNYTMTIWGNEAKDRFLADTLIKPLREGMAEPEQLNGEPNPMSPDLYWVDQLDSNMLKSAQMPAVIVEGSFLSATWEARAFLDGREDGTHWREQQIADLVHEGLNDFFDAFE